MQDLVTYIGRDLKKKNNTLGKFAIYIVVTLPKNEMWYVDHINRDPM